LRLDPPVPLVPGRLSDEHHPEVFPGRLQ